MKKKPFDRDKMYDEKLDKNIDKDADKTIESALKSAFAEEGKDLHLTDQFKSSLISQMEQIAKEEKVNSSNGVIHSIRHFLNREIEIPLMPLLAASVLLIAINVIPLNYEPRPEGRIIEVGGSQLWIPYNGEGEDVAYEN